MKYRVSMTHGLNLRRSETVKADMKSELTTCRSVLSGKGRALNHKVRAWMTTVSMALALSFTSCGSQDESPTPATLTPEDTEAEGEFVGDGIGRVEAGV